MDKQINVLNNPNILLKNDNNVYNNVLLHTGNNKNREWNNLIAINDNKEIIKNSNIYITFNTIYPKDFWKYQNDEYKIFDNLENNYNILINNNNNINNTLYDDKLYFMMMDPFTLKNSGHNLSTLLDQAKYIITNNITNILIYKDFKDSNNYKIIKTILPKDVVFYLLDYDTSYYIKNVIIIEQQIANMYLHTDLIQEIINKIQDNYLTNYSDYLSKNIILMKTNRNKNAFVSNTLHNCELFLKELEEKEFINIIPEEDDIFKVIIMLLNAKNIVTSEGAISFTNHIFFNKNSNVIYIGKNKLYEYIASYNSKNFHHINMMLTDNNNKYTDVISDILLHCD
jgi:hypothetical protein